MIRLSVPFAEKELVKQHGARWNADGRFWFYPGEELPEALKPWALKQAGESHEPSPYLTVSQVSELIRNCYYRAPELQHLLVQGEVTDYSPTPSGIRFSLKDDGALLHCVLWNNKIDTALEFPLNNGQQVAVSGALSYYAGQSRTQLVVEKVTDQGSGRDSLALKLLTEKLEKEGLFDPNHKKPIPRYPAVVGIVSSKNGQAIRDICKVAAKRNPYVQLVLYHVTVQGKNAEESIVRGIQTMDAYGVDTMIVGRGGGSMEELSLYNSEAIVRAVYEAKTPLVSAVGHAGNWTLIDRVADLYVATPTEAAEETVPDVMTEIRKVQALLRVTKAHFHNHLLQKNRRLDLLQASLEHYHPRRMLEERKNRTLYCQADLLRGIQRIFNQKKNRWEREAARLHALAPTAKLVRGFGYISIKGRALTEAGQARPGDDLEIMIHDGRIETRVTKINRSDNHE